MRFSLFSEYLSKLDSTSSRLEITKIISEMIRKLEESEAAQGVFLSLGTLSPSYEGIDFGISEKLMTRIVARAFGVKDAEVAREFKSVGDLGEVAQELRMKNSELRIKNLDVADVYGRLKEIAEAGGSGSVEKKISLSAELLRCLDPLSTRYVVRIPLGTMRLGFSEKTILEALVLLEGGGKDASFARDGASRKIKENLESKYNVYPNIGEITRVFKKLGLAGLSKIKIRVGVPILAQLCGRLETAQEMMEKVGGPKALAAAEY